MNNERDAQQANDGETDGSSKEIPFRGPSNVQAWTGGNKAEIKFDLNILNEPNIVGLLPGEGWTIYDMSDPISLFPSGNITIIQWATMGMWRKKLFSMLFILSARVPDFAITSYWNDRTSQMALIVRKENEVFVEVGYGSSKTKSKEAVAERMIHSANIWNWLNEKHSDTPCDRYLRQSS